MIVPWWGAQFWFPLMLQRLRDFLIQLPQAKKYTDFTVKERESSSTTSRTKATGGSFIREAINNRELPQEIEDVITDSWQTPQNQDMSLCSNDGNAMH